MTTEEQNTQDRAADLVWLQGQIQAYVDDERPRLEAFTRLLEALLHRARESCAPKAIVQARTKDTTSFAEKCLRRSQRPASPVHEFTDLCGGRIIVHTTQELPLVRRFIEETFELAYDPEDRSERLGIGEFGYRSVHYIVQLPADLPERVTLSPEEQTWLAAANEGRVRSAEIQVRTMMQHVWADNVHDRFYKTRVKLPTEYRRETSRLAAVLEAADSSFSELVAHVDAFQINYGAYLDEEEIAFEIKTLESLLAQPSLRRDQGPRLALRLAQVARARSDWPLIIETLAAFVDGPARQAPELQLEYGLALCRQHVATPAATAFGTGQGVLQAVADLPIADVGQGLHAQALSLLGWSYERARADSGYLRQAYDCYYQAYLSDPGSPYHFAAYVEANLKYTRSAESLAVLGPNVDQAIRRAEEHAAAGIELPYAHLLCGKLHALSGRLEEAVHGYCRALRVTTSDAVLQDEIRALEELHNETRGAIDADVLRTLVRLLRLGRVRVLADDVDQLPGDDALTRMPDAEQGAARARADAMRASQSSILDALGGERLCPHDSDEQVVVVAGAGRMDESTAASAQALLAAGLAGFTGSLVSGGTTTGVPGCLGTVRAAAASDWKLIGYAPRGASGLIDRERYDEVVETPRLDFSVAEPLQAWTDLLGSGIDPRRVALLAIGGGTPTTPGAITRMECCIALALGARVGVVTCFSGSSTQLLQDSWWSGHPKLLALPGDAMTLVAFLNAERSDWERPEWEAAAKQIHENYQKDQKRAWDKIPDDFRRSNYHQAMYAEVILRAAGLKVAKEPPQDATLVADLDDVLSEAEIEHLAQMEHGRWNVERLIQGWTYGPAKDEVARTHFCLVPWEQLPEEYRRYDHDAVKAFPGVLAKAGLVVYREASP